MRFHRIFIPAQAVGANLVYFDLFVPTTGAQTIKVMSCQPVVSGAVAVTGLVGVDLLLTKTSAVGTGGTAMTQSGTSITAMTITPHDSSQIFDLADMSGRLTPTGGATAGGILSWGSVYTEEANSAAYTLAADLARNLYPDIPGVALTPGTGIRVIQGAVASVGNIGFNLIISSTPK